MSEVIAKSKQHKVCAYTIKGSSIPYHPPLP